MQLLDKYKFIRCFQYSYGIRKSIIRVIEKIKAVEEEVFKNFFGQMQERIDYECDKLTFT